MPAGVFFLRNFLSQSLQQYPLSHGLRRASSPKGTPFGNAGKFAITAQSRPLGEGGCERSEQTEGVHSGESLTGKNKTERVFPRSHFFYQSVTFRFVLFVVYYGQHGSPWQH